ncbi:hypothetical protein GCM10027360_00610 [Amycolatopsis echigonensis]
MRIADDQVVGRQRSGTARSPDAPGTPTIPYLTDADKSRYSSGNPSAVASCPASPTAPAPADPRPTRPSPMPERHGPGTRSGAAPLRASGTAPDRVVRTKSKTLPQPVGAAP